MSLDEDLRAKIVTIVGGSVPVQQDYASTDKVQPRVWYQHASGDAPLATSRQTLIRTDVYAVEVEGMDPGEVGTLVDSLTATWTAGGLNGFLGTMGSTVVLGMFVEDHGDDFRFRGLGLDEGYHSWAFNLRILT